MLQEGEIDKIGRKAQVSVDVRIIAATNRNLEEEVKAKRFREDLYYRLNVISIHVPPLSSRKEDIFILFNHFAEKFSTKMNRRLPVLSDAALKLLMDYPWPGNVRELENISQRLLFIPDSKIDETHIKMVPGMNIGDSQKTSVSNLWDADNIQPWRKIEESLQREYLIFVRENTSSDAKASRKLGLAPPNYHRMCKKLGIK